MSVSRQAITKWETDGGIPDVSNLQRLSKVFGITVDYLLNDENQLPTLSMVKELNKNKYNGKKSYYTEILKEYYPAPCDIYTLTKTKKMSKLEAIFDYLLGQGLVCFFPLNTHSNFNF